MTASVTATGTAEVSGLCRGQLKLTEVNPKLKAEGTAGGGLSGGSQAKHPSPHTSQEKAWMQEQDSVAKCGEV